MKFPTIIAATFASAALSACATAPVGSQVATGGQIATGADAYKVAPSIADAKTPDSSPISVGDELSLAVMGEPDLSFTKLVVDDAGRIQMPLAGSVKVAGLSPAEASHLIETKLGERYLKYPQVTINVNTAAEKFVSVEGQVNHAGAYPINASTTLLGAVSMAQSPTRIAKLNETMVFRTVNGKRMVARFDLNRIRKGLDPDPQILGGDVVVVGFSQLKSGYRDVIQMAPLFNLFLVRF